MATVTAIFMATLNRCDKAMMMVLFLIPCWRFEKSEGNITNAQGMWLKRLLISSCAFVVMHALGFVNMCDSHRQRRLHLIS